MTIDDEDQIIQTAPLQSAAEAIPSQPLQQSNRKIRIGLGLTLIGYAVFLLGARPSMYGLDRSPVIGFVQIAVLIGIGLISGGAYITMQALWQEKPTSILSQIGMRLVQTGFVISLFTGLADIFGLGSHSLSRPFFGPLQSIGVQMGEFVIGLGIIMMFPFHRIFPSHLKRFTKSSVDEINSEYQ